MGNPKVLSDLKNSGIDFKILSNRHTTPNVEFKSTLAKCKRLLTAFPVNKRALMLFRSITDTVTDGRLDLMKHIGISIDLENPNMATLAKKIETKKAEREAREAQEAQAKVPEKPPEKQRTMPVRNSTGQFVKNKAPPKAGPASRMNALRNAATNSGRNSPALPKLPGGITITKVKQEEIKKEPIEQSMILERPDTIDVEANDSEITVNQAKVRKALNEIERKHLPANRQMKTDVIFDCLHLRTDSSALLADHGIIYNQKLGKHHLKVLAGQRKVHKTG